MPKAFDMLQYYKNVYGGIKVTWELNMSVRMLAAKEYIYKFVKPGTKVDFFSDRVKTCVCELVDLLTDRYEQGRLCLESYDKYKRQYRVQDWNKLIFETIELYFPKEDLYRGVE